MNQLLSESSLFYRQSSWTISCSNFNHIQRVDLHPEFFSMSNPSDTICLYHTISSIMKSRFWSLICQLSSPTPVFKEGSECKKVFWLVLSEYKQRLNFRATTKSICSTLSPWSLEKEEAEEQSVVVSFWPALGSRHVSHLIKTPKDRRHDKPSKASTWEHHPVVLDDTPSEESTAQRTLLFPKNPLTRGRSSFRERRDSKINHSGPEQDDHTYRLHWYPPTFMESVTPLGHLTFQTL